MAYTLIYAEAYFDLGDWYAVPAASAVSAAADKIYDYYDTLADGGSNSNSSSDSRSVDASACNAALVLHGYWARSMPDANWHLSTAKALLARLQHAQTYSSRVRFQHYEALV